MARQEYDGRWDEGSGKGATSDAISTRNHQVLPPLRSKSLMRINFCKSGAMYLRKIRLLQYNDLLSGERYDYFWVRWFYMKPRAI